MSRRRRYRNAGGRRRRAYAGLRKKGPRSGFERVYGRTAAERRAVRAVDFATEGLDLRPPRRAAHAINEAVEIVQALRPGKLKRVLIKRLAEAGDRLNYLERPILNPKTYTAPKASHVRAARSRSERRKLAMAIWRAKHPDYRSDRSSPTHPSVLANVHGRTIILPLMELSLTELRDRARKARGWRDGRKIASRNPQGRRRNNTDEDRAKAAFEVAKAAIKRGDLVEARSSLREAQEISWASWPMQWAMDTISMSAHYMRKLNRRLRNGKSAKRRRIR